MDGVAVRPINADELTAPLVHCVISGGENGWFHCDVRTTAKTSADAELLARKFLEQVFPGKRKVTRTEPEASESRDFEFDCRVVAGYCRFAFRLEDGPTEAALRSGGTEIIFHQPSVETTP